MVRGRSFRLDGRPLCSTDIGPLRARPGHPRRLHTAMGPVRPTWPLDPGYSAGTGHIWHMGLLYNTVVAGVVLFFHW